MKIKIFLVISGIAVSLMFALQDYILGSSVALCLYISCKLLTNKGKYHKLEKIVYHLFWIMIPIFILICLLNLSIDILRYGFEALESKNYQSKIIYIWYEIYFLSSLGIDEFLS